MLISKRWLVLWVRIFVGSLPIFIGPPAFAQSTELRTERETASEVMALRKALALSQMREKEWSQEPLTQSEFDLQQRRIERLIERLQRGERVSPQDINEVLKSPTGC
jgi:hypothetical protein